MSANIDTLEQTTNEGRTMTYVEFVNLTDPEATLLQYHQIECIYAACAACTKEMAAEIWKMTYGKDLEATKVRRAEITTMRDCGDGTMVMDRSYLTTIQQAFQGVEEVTFKCMHGLWWRRRQVLSQDYGNVLVYKIECFTDGEWRSSGWCYSNTSGGIFQCPDNLMAA